MKQPKSITQVTLEIAKDVLNAFLTIIKFCLAGGLSSGGYKSNYWEEELQRERTGYYKDD